VFALYQFARQQQQQLCCTWAKRCVAYKEEEDTKNMLMLQKQ